MSSQARIYEFTQSLGPVFPRVNEALLTQAAANGFRNFVYGPITRAEHEECRQLGVDGVITDYPLLMQGV